MPQLPLLSVVAGLALAPSAAQADVRGLLAKAFPPGEEACYGRAYDAAHLKAHPRQRVSGLYLFKTFTPDPQREEPQHPRTVQIDKDRKDAATETARWASMLVRFKDKPGRLFKQEVECMGTDQTGFFCSRDCDGGGFGAKPAGSGLLIEQGKTMQGLRLQSSCGPDEEGSDEQLEIERQALRLERQNHDVCLASATPRGRPGLRRRRCASGWPTVAASATPASMTPRTWHATQSRK